MVSPSPAPRRRRAVIRAVVYGSLAAVVVAFAVFVLLRDRPFRPQESERWIQTDYARLPEVRLLQRYVQIDTSPTTGDEVAGARFLADRLAEAGIPSHLERLDGKHANLWAVLEGKSPEAVVLHNHIDVTPVDPKEWFSPPYEARIQLPWIYGRGVFDMKSVAIAQLQALIALKKSGVQPARSVIFLGTGGEEYGSFLGTRWILAQHPELVKRFWAVLTEGGTVEARTRGDVKYWGTEFAQKRFADLIVCGSDLQRLQELREVVQKEGHSAVTGLTLLPEVRTFLQGYAPSRDRQDLRDLFAHPDRVLSDIAAFRKLPAYVQSMFRNEAVPFALHEALGGGYELDIKFHLLPGVELAQVRDQLVPPWMTHGLTTLLVEPPTSRHGSPPDHPVMAAIHDAVLARHPGAGVGPMFLAWTATDSRFYRAAGIPSYGFSPFLIMNTDTFQVDAANERMALPAFVDGIHLYADVLRRLTH
ncbi:MAG TPA: M20/M25/M40 family metallo-hydrolase [Thermoanaerobaculia bacterium]|nr:M20/M25/M40 family metallo-hydrolase [Thermoanaerobaculia bacterium]